MTLTIKDLSSLFDGTVRVVKKEGFLIPCRFTKEQLLYYKGLNHPKKTDFFEKALASSNIRIAFRTDSPFFSFDYYVSRASGREFYYFDVLVDGSLVLHQGEEDVYEGAGKIRVALPEGEHLVTVYCPTLFSASVANFTVADGATVTPVSKKRRIPFLGDSLTQGYDAKFPSGTYANLLADMLDATSVNQGIGGETFNPDMIDPDLGFAPDLMLVSYGQNDYTKCKKEEMAASAAKFYRRLREAYPKAKIFSLLPVWRTDCDKVHAMSYAETIEIAREAALQAHAIPIDGMKVIPHMHDFYSKTKTPHPNDLGMRFCANGIFAAIKPHIKEV